MKIFLLEDDYSLRNGLVFKLGREGYEAICAENYNEAAVLLDKHRDTDIFLLDVTLSDSTKTGLDFCVYAKKILPSAYYIFLTAQDSEISIINGYDAGADDYVTKPFSVSVLLSKIQALARRIETAGNAANAGRCQDEPCLDAINQTLLLKGKSIKLSVTEFRIMNKFIENEGHILTKENILESVWGIDGNYIDDNALAVNIRRLREKIESTPSEPVIIKNIRGTGYIFDSNAVSCGGGVKDKK